MGAIIGYQKCGYQKWSHFGTQNDCTLAPITTIILFEEIKKK